MVVRSPNRSPLSPGHLSLLVLLHNGQSWGWGRGWRYSSSMPDHASWSLSVRLARDENQLAG